jgi:hypothetical protein
VPDTKRRNIPPSRASATVAMTNTCIEPIRRRVANESVAMAAIVPVVKKPRLSAAR